MKLNLITIIFCFGILSILIFGKHAFGYCYDNEAVAASGKISYLHTQSIYGIDCFTGRFEPPLHLSKSNGYYWSFETFRAFFLLTIVWLVMDLYFLYRRKYSGAFVMAILAFISCIVCAIYFDGFHNYYAGGMERFHWSGVNSITRSVEYYWLLSNPLFWVLFMGTLALHLVPQFKKFSEKKSMKRDNLLDN